MCDGDVHWCVESLERCHKVRTLWGVTKVTVPVDLKVDLRDNWSTEVVSIQVITSAVTAAVPVSCLYFKLSRLPPLPIVE